MSSDQELDPDQLPRGHTPMWIQTPDDASEIEMMERFIKIPELKQYNINVTVLYEKVNYDVMDMCHKLGWRYIEAVTVSGLEDQVVILLNTTLTPEYLTRGINLLIIATIGSTR